MGRYSWAVMCLLLWMVSSIAWAGVPSDIAWSQYPDMYHGLDFASELKTPYAVADDWSVTSDLLVSDIHWWGSYWAHTPETPYTHYSDSLPNAEAGGMANFLIRIWTDVPKSENNQYSHPGEPIWSYEATVFSETEYGTTTFGEKVYYYSLLLPQEKWFAATKDAVYWVSIMGNVRTPTGAPDQTKQWGWHESSNHWNDAAVQGYWSEQNPNWNWYTLNNNMYDNDMAFQLTTVPEPGSLATLAVGCFGVAAWMAKYRKNRLF
jgi:hypothetical protein